MATRTCRTRPRGGIGHNHRPDFDAKVVHGDITAIDAAGNPLHASLVSQNRLQLSLPSGAAGHGAPMTNTATTVAKTPTVMPPGWVLLVPLQTPVGATAPTR